MKNIHFERDKTLTFTTDNFTWYEHKVRKVCHISDCDLGDTIEIGDNEFVIFARGRVNHTGFIISKKPIYLSAYGRGNDSWDKSYVRKAFNDHFLRIFEEEIGWRNIIEAQSYNRAEDGTESALLPYDKINILSTYAYKWHRKYIPKYNTPIWTCTPLSYTAARGEQCYIDRDGTISHAPQTEINSACPLIVLRPDTVVSKIISVT